MEKKKTTYTLRQYLKYRFTILLVIFGVFLLLLGFMIAATYFLNEDYILYLLYGLTLGVLGAAIAFTFYFLSCIYKYVWKEGFQVSKRNYQTLVNFDKDFEYCSTNQFEELRELNTLFKDLSKNLDGRTIISKTLNEDALGLEYLDEGKTLVSEQSLCDHIKDLILAREAFRNGLLDISYELSGEEISQKDHEYLLGAIKKHLPYTHLLIAKKNKGDGYIVYIPAFDSISQLKEELEALERNISLIKKTTRGRIVINAFMSLVVYPYSSFENMVSDLSIAKRAKKPIHIYFPERKVEENKKMLISSLNMNNVSRLLEEISSIDPSPNKHASNLKKIFDSIRNIASYYGFTTAGFINYDKDRDGYYNSFACSETDSYVFKQYTRMNKKFINALANVADSDGSYYFSSRKHVNDEIARYLDEYRVRSGMFYVVRVIGYPVAIVYFLNKSNEMAYDAFMKENLVVASNLIGNYFKELETRRASSTFERRFNDLIKVSGEYIYGLDKETMQITYASDTLKQIAPGVVSGEKCYKALHGLDAPCEECPLKSGKRIVKNISGESLEALVTMANKDDTCHHILLKPTLDGRTHERYDDETMMATFYSFRESLEKQLTFGLDGHVLFLTIKNVFDIIEKVGASGFADSLRQFNEGMRELYKRSFDMYYYGKDTLAIILPRSSENDILSLAELLPDGKIRVNVKDQDIRLDIVYLCKAYSKGDTLPGLIESFENALSHAGSLPVDEILFVDSGYKRSASKEGYLFEVLVKAFEDKKFSVNFQPILRNSDRLIVGAELLLRVEDEKTQEEIDIGPAVEIAWKRGYSATITKALVDYTNELISKYGYTFFFTSGLQHFSINTDYTFFNDKEFAEKLSDLVAKNSLPEGFIVLEVVEEDIKNHKADYERVCAVAKKIGCAMLCDQYTGDYMPVEELKKLGFDVIKFSKKLVEKIKEEDTNKKVMDAWSEAIKVGIDVSFVGVSNRLISEAIVNGDNDTYVQGNYFFKPMPEEEMLDAIRERNMKEKDIDL